MAVLTFFVFDTVQHGDEVENDLTSAESSRQLWRPLYRRGNLSLLLEIIYVLYPCLKRLFMFSKCGLFFSKFVGMDFMKTLETETCA